MGMALGCQSGRGVSGSPLGSSPGITLLEVWLATQSQLSMEPLARAVRHYVLTY